MLTLTPRFDNIIRNSAKHGIRLQARKPLWKPSQPPRHHHVRFVTWADLREIIAFDSKPCSQPDHARDYKISAVRYGDVPLISLYHTLFCRPRRVRLNHTAQDYRRIVRNLLKKHPGDPALALAQAIGSVDMDTFRSQGDGHVAVLRHHGLVNGMSVYDLGCGCGRTAQALQRLGWKGQYTGADVVPELLAELQLRCPDYAVALHCDPSIAASDSSVDMVFHWSVFTHLFPAECYLYLQDAFRALKPGGRMVFSFLELEEPLHDRVWRMNIDHLINGQRAEQLDQFLHRDWIRRFALDAGFTEPRFTDGGDDTMHPSFWQSLAVIEKPA